MLNHVCAFSQSETEKYFEWIIIIIIWRVFAKNWVSRNCKKRKRKAKKWKSSDRVLKNKVNVSESSLSAYHTYLCSKIWGKKQNSESKVGIQLCLSGFWSYVNARSWHGIWIKPKCLLVKAKFQGFLYPWKRFIPVNISLSEKNVQRKLPIGLN